MNKETNPFCNYDILVQAGYLPSEAKLTKMAIAAGLTAASMGALLTTGCGVSGVDAETNPKTEAPEPTKATHTLEATDIPKATLPPITETATLAPTVMNTEIPVNTATSTIEATAKPEVKNYGICAVENFEQCPITEDELYNGEYDAFLDTLSKPFDPSTFKNPLPKLRRFGLFGIMYSGQTAPNFPDGGMPFRVGETFTELKLDDGRKYIAINVEYPNPSDPTNVKKNVRIKLLAQLFLSNAAKSYSRDMTPDNIANHVAKIKTMKVFPIQTAIIDIENGGTDVMMAKTFAEYPDIENRFDRFVKGDTEALDGLVLKTVLIENYPAFK